MFIILALTYNEILSIGDWKNLTPKEFIGFEHET